MPTDDSRRLVAEMVARGSIVADIARAVGLSEPTLRAHYRAELAGPRPQKNIPLPEFDGPAPPRPSRDRAGRPPHVPTDETREEVAILLGGMQQWQVAQALGIAESTLRAHYAEQINAGRARKKADIIIAMHRSGVGGNVAAQKAYLALDQDLDVPPEEAPPPRPEPLGKKQIADREAQTAGAGIAWARHLPH